MKLAKKHEERGITQFELSKIVLNNLKCFKLTPIGKLVLLVLVDCYNPENGSVVFPSIDFIAEKAGVGLTATKQAIKDLISEGLIIKSKRGKIHGNYNKYLLTPKVQNSTAEQSENEFFKQSDSDRLHEQQTKENKKITNVVNLKSKKDDTELLEQYAKKMGAQNVRAYVNALKISGAAAKVIDQEREKEGVKIYWNKQAIKTSELVQEYKTLEADEPTESFKALKAKLIDLCRQ